MISESFRVSVRTSSSSLPVQSIATGGSTRSTNFPRSGSQGAKIGIISACVRKASLATIKFVEAGTPKKSTKIASSSSVFRSNKRPSASPERRILTMERAAESLSNVRLPNRTRLRSAARSMVKILRSGEALGLLLDLNTLDDEAIFVDFFGVPASTNFMVAKLALRTQAEIIPIFAPWEPERGKFVLRVEPPVAMDCTGNEDEDVRTLTLKLSLIIEEQIRRYPDQWLWIHKRWKTRPAGEPSLY